MSALHHLAEKMGILPMFHGLDGQEHWTNDDTRRALLRAMGVAAETEETAQASLDALYAEEAARIAPPEFVVTAGHAASIPVWRPCDWALLREDGSEVLSGFAEQNIEIPALDVGVFRIAVQAGADSQEIFVPARPEHAPRLAEGQRVWGVTAPLYGLRSDRNLGFGDFADLGELGNVLGRAGASFLGINPIHSWGWAAPEVISPYSPSHRGFLNTAHIACDAVPGLVGVAAAEALVAEAAAEVDRAASLVDYNAFAWRQRALLEKLFAVFENDAGAEAKAQLAAFVADSGPELLAFAKFEVLSQMHGPVWREWPVEAQAPKTANVAPEAMGFHLWLQWVADSQLSGLAKSEHLSLGLYLDLAVGARRDGAEAWMAQDSVAKGVSLGAPPDALGPDGQNWQLTAYAPRLAAKTGYRYLRNLIRQTARHAGVIRVDHVLGLNRSFWIPDDGSPGAYVRQPFETLLALVAIEAHQANCVVIGEDLGLVPEGFRETLAGSGLYGYSVLQYEREHDGSFRDPSHLRPQSLACFATHDTPSLYGFCAARDIDWWEKLGVMEAEHACHLRDQRRGDCAALVPEGQDPAIAIHGRLAGSPAAMVAVQFDDILGEVEAQNLPGTIDEHPNWQRQSAVSVEEMNDLPALGALARLMADAGRAYSDPDKES